MSTIGNASDVYQLPFHSKLHVLLLSVWLERGYVTSRLYLHAQNVLYHDHRDTLYISRAAMCERTRVPLLLDSTRPSFHSLETDGCCIDGLFA